MRLGGPIFEKSTDPTQWAAAHKRLGYGAVYAPILDPAETAQIEAYARAASDAGLVIAEVGAWSNPLSLDAETRAKAIALNESRLALADRIGARCCVNVSGSRGHNWAGPDASNFSDDTFDLIVQTVRGIIDAVRPTRTFYALETMPNMYPDSPDCYLRLINAIDRGAFAAHLDPTNLICSPQRFANTTAIIRQCFETLRPYIRSCHAKDVALSDKALVHLDEVIPGRGGLDYHTFLRELDKLDPQTPLMLEHLTTADEYAEAAAHVRKVAGEVGANLE